MSAAQRRRKSGMRQRGQQLARAASHRHPPVSLSIGGTVRRDDGAHKVDHGAWSTADRARRRRRPRRGRRDPASLGLVGEDTHRHAGGDVGGQQRRTRNQIQMPVGTRARQRYWAPVSPRTRSSLTRSESEAKRAHAVPAAEERHGGARPGPLLAHVEQPGEQHEQHDHVDELVERGLVEHHAPAERDARRACSPGRCRRRSGRRAGTT